MWNFLKHKPSNRISVLTFIPILTCILTNQFSLGPCWVKKYNYMYESSSISPWSRSEADTVNTLVPGGWFSDISASYWLSSNQGTSSLTSITWTHSSWLDECWGIPWSSAIIVRLKMSCSSRSKGLKIDREPVERRIRGEMWGEISCMCVCVCVSVDGCTLLQTVSQRQLRTTTTVRKHAIKRNKTCHFPWLCVVEWFKKQVWKVAVWGPNQS